MQEITSKVEIQNWANNTTWTQGCTQTHLGDGMIQYKTLTSTQTVDDCDPHYRGPNTYYHAAIDGRTNTLDHLRPLSPSEEARYSLILQLFPLPTKQLNVGQHVCLASVSNTAPVTEARNTTIRLIHQEYIEKYLSLGQHSYMQLHNLLRLEYVMGSEAKRVPLYIFRLPQQYLVANHLHNKGWLDKQKRKEYITNGSYDKHQSLLAFFLDNRKEVTEEDILNPDHGTHAHKYFVLYECPVIPLHGNTDTLMLLLVLHRLSKSSLLYSLPMEIVNIILSYMKAPPYCNSCKLIAKVCEQGTSFVHLMYLLLEIGGLIQVAVTNFPKPIQAPIMLDDD